MATVRPLAIAAALVGASLTTGCGSEPPRRPESAARSARPSTRQLTADTTIATPSGATLLAPKGWWLTEGGGALVLEDPERDLRATLVETAEPDPARAIAAAWRRIAPGFALDVKRSEQPPPDDGWDAVTHLTYRTRASEGRVVEALARRHGATSYVALVEGALAAYARREAQLETALWTLHPKGMRAESFAGQTPRALDAARARELDAFIDDARARLRVPGAAVAVIQGGRVVYEKTTGVRVVGSADPVSPTTLFLMASITKPMTTLMQAALVDAGLFGWDTAVTSLLPDFALGDAATTRALALWHTSCACTGMPRQDLENIFEFSDVTPEARIASMRSMRPTTALGETFQYSNLLVAVGGYAAAHAFAPGGSLQEAYDAAMQAKVFLPIGMTSTTVDFAAAERAAPALPHAVAIDGTVRPIPLAMERAMLPIAPAGAAWSNLRDMERYALTELAGGVSPDGVRVASEASWRERRTVRVRDGESSGYGLGLGVGSFHGLTELGHDGGAFGYATRLFLLPDQQIAIVILTNVRNGGPYEQLPFPQAVQRKIVEALFAGAKKLAATDLAYYADARRDADARAVDGLDRAPDAAWLRGLAGRYHNPALGRVDVRVDAGGGVFDAGEWRSAFARRTDSGEVKLVLVDPPFAGGELVVGGDAAHPTLTSQAGQLVYVFERAPGQDPR